MQDFYFEVIYLFQFYMFIFVLIIRFPSTHKPLGNIYEKLNNFGDIKKLFQW